MVRNRIDVISLGCSKNLVDSEKLMRQLEHQGYTVFHNPEKIRGEIVVINTCGFIGDAKEESVNMILEACQEKALHHINKVFVMGCLSERYAVELNKEIPEVDKYYGKFNWNELLADLGKEYNCSIQSQRTLTTPSHYAYLKISEGCNRACAYCAIPIITGKHVSRPIGDIIDEAQWLIDQGVKEIQLIAQDLTYYGSDLYHKQNIAELVDKLSDLPGVEWLRLHYGYPTHFPYDLLTVMRDKNNICKYLDLALQHISDPVLKNMRRNITAEETYSLLETIRKEVPGIFLRTTLMVGFPGETEADFELLKEFVKTIRFERMGTFAYSEEEGTYAAKHYIDDVPNEVKEARVSELMSIQQGIAEEISESLVGKTMKVIIDREEGDFYVGRTEYDSPEVDSEVLFLKKNKRLKIGELYTSKITDSNIFDLFAETI